MKSWRRIEITAFRRRTTVILRNKPAGGHVEPSQAGGADLNCHQAAATVLDRAVSAGQSEKPEDSEETVTKKQAGQLSSNRRGDRFNASS